MPLTRRTTLVLVGLVLLALNLRPAAVSVGPVLAEVRDGLGMSAASAGLLTSLPVLAFAFFGALAPALASRIGLHRVTLLALLCLVTGLGARVLVDHEAAFLAWSMLALAGMAVANVVLPSLVKLHFPDRIGLVTAIYTTALSIGLTAALWLTVPIAERFGDWRQGLGAWALIAAVAVVPWLGLVGRDRQLERPERTITYGQVLRTRLGIAMALFFGFQSLQAYVIFGWFASLWRDEDFTAAQAGLLVGLLTATAIPLSLWAPTRLAKSPDPRRLLFAFVGCYLVGYVGLLIAPHEGRDRLGAAHRRRHDDVPPRAHPRRPPGPDSRGHRGAVERDPVPRLPDRGGRPVLVRGAARRDRRLDLAAGGAHPAGAAAVRAGGVRRQAGRDRGPAQATSRSRSALSCSSVIPPDRR